MSLSADRSTGMLATERMISWLSRHWLILTGLLIGIYVIVPAASSVVDGRRLGFTRESYLMDLLIAVLRQFTGNPQMGWKIAWSDRMVAMFTSLWVFGLLWG